MMSKEDPGGHFAIRVAIAYVPASVTTGIAVTWLPKPLSWALSMFVWLILAYWFPPKSRMKFGRWLLIVTTLSFLTWFFVRLQPHMF
jgi:hypothetical protein